MGRERTAAGGRRNGTVGAARVALAVLVVGGVALGALLLRPGTGLFGKGRGPLGGSPLLVAGLALLSLLGGLALREKYLSHVDPGQERDPVEQRLVDTVSRVLMAAPVAVPLLALALHRFGAIGVGHGHVQAPKLQDPSLRRNQVRKPHPVDHTRHHESALHFGLLRILLGIGIALLVLAVVIAGVHLWRHLTRPPAPAEPATYGTLDDEQERLAQAVDSGRRALSDAEDARMAVIACYVAMQESLAESGVARHASDSPQDLLERAVRDGLPAQAAAAELTALFREARYSTHPMNSAHRDRAAAALAEIADGLDARASGAGTVAGVA
ncbi:DUF4129 domain-containing protein [Actinacidiphila acidipaludis]|uniref:DUF4129 domain-containing protein n=1 Tax=Actinacidiphila acidipaludis TaxID=2873382 RepID=UPI0027E0B4F4|nr:DUF4129 domain-containing protein [Streptomyces acidipaludis]